MHVDDERRRITRSRQVPLEVVMLVLQISSLPFIAARCETFLDAPVFEPDSDDFFRFGER